jgi:phenylpropionate dioxygenase-like ring-hydroxylating dioxygenase large terminal subunit
MVISTRAYKHFPIHTVKQPFLQMKKSVIISYSVLAFSVASIGLASGFQIPSKPLRSTPSRFRSLNKSHQLIQQQAVSIGEDTIETFISSTPDDNDFNWFKAWYPVVPVEFLDDEKPHAFKLLGIDIVVWNDGPVDTSPLFGPRKERAKGAKKSDGNWRVFVNQCPHRKVPLSEGRIEDDGSLLCSYHGWRFNGKGETIDVPQISKTSEVERIRANPKSKCNSFPVKMIDGVLWVWPDASEDSRIEAALAPVPSLDMDPDVKEERIWKGNWNFRELPYGHDYFIENVVDPAHVPISHHNVVGSRYNDQSLTIQSLNPLTKEGFSIATETPASSSGTTSFTAPSQVLIKSPFGKEGAAQYLELYSSPSRPGFCNHVGRIVVIKDKSNQMPKLLKQFTLPLPTWLNHILASAFLHQDALFLHGQERSLAHYGEYRSSSPGTNDSYAKATMLCSVDKGVLKFRTWMKEFAGGHIPFKGDPSMPATDNEVVFDTWNSHVKHCKYCLDALKNLKRMRAVSFMASALLAAVRPEKLGVVGSTLGALALSGLGYLLNKFIGMFYRYEFSHAENH